MIYKKTFKLKNGEILQIANPSQEDIFEWVACENKIKSETPFLSRCERDEDYLEEDFKDWASDFNMSNKDVVLICKINNKIVGSGHIESCGNKFKFRHRCSIDLAILKEYWGIGIGANLFKSLIECAKEMGYEQIELSVASKNERAIKLYEKNGFIKVGSLPHAEKFEDDSYDDYFEMIKCL